MPDETSAIDLSTLEFPADPSKLPTSKELPLGDIELEITSWSAYLTKEVTEESDPVAFAKGNRGKKLAFKGQFKATAPAEIAGLPYTHDVYVGSNVDPLARKESTWASGGGTEIMKILKQSKTHLGATTKPQEALLASVGQRLVGEVKTEKDRRGVYPDKHKVKGWHKVGDRQPRLAGDVGGVIAPVAAQPAPVFENNE